MQPVINSISPASPMATVGNQNVSVLGSGFQQGLTVTVTFPSGGQTTLSGSQIQSVTVTSFVMVIDFNGNAGSYSIRVNNLNGTQSNTFGFIAQAPLTPTISNINPLSTPIPGQQFFARLTGTNFNTSTAEVVVNGPACAPCGVPNGVLTNMNGTRFDAPFTLAAGTFQVQVRNGSSGPLSNPQPLTVQAPPTNKTLVWTGSGTVYWFQNGKIYGVTGQTYLDMQRNAGVTGWSTINTFQSLGYPQGPLFVSLTDNASNGLLLKVYGLNPAVYLIENRQKRILSFEEFNRVRLF